jgi:hypothetical protein
LQTATVLFRFWHSYVPGVQAAAVATSIRAERIDVNCIVGMKVKMLM